MVGEFEKRVYVRVMMIDGLSNAALRFGQQLLCSDYGCDHNEKHRSYFGADDECCAADVMFAATEAPRGGDGDEHATNSRHGRS
jgi:hypothetical protein